MQKTTNLQLNKIELADSPPDITVLNANWDKIESELYPTIDVVTVPTGNQGFVKALLGGIANRIKAITGKANWWDAPSKSLEQLYTDKVDKVNGKGLSTNDFDNNYKTAVDNVALKHKYKHYSSLNDIGLTDTNMDVSEFEKTVLTILTALEPYSEITLWSSSSIYPNLSASIAGYLSCGGYPISSDGGYSLVIKANGSTGLPNDIYISPNNTNYLYYVRYDNSLRGVSDLTGTVLTTKLPSLCPTLVNNRIRIPADGWLEMYTDAGSYFVGSNADGATIIDLPVPVSGNLDVSYEYNTIQTITQRFYAYAKKEYYTRRRYEFTWSPWTKTVNDADFTQSLATSGWEKNAITGVIEQWGSTNVASVAANTQCTKAITFPVSFPTKCTCFSASFQPTITNDFTRNHEYPTSLAAATCGAKNGATAQGFTMYWRATGY
jgi:hypothetical protein